MARKNASLAPPRPARDRVETLHPADQALQRNSKEFLPDELHAGFDAILAAFAHYEAGRDDEARAALEPVGLRSPFLEWKVLLRGLMAHAANDDARALENFARLDPVRLPAKLAEPYRAAIDPASCPVNRDPLLRRYETLNSGGLAAALRVVAKHLGREKPLSSALRAAGDALPLLRKTAPQLEPHLAACLSHAIVRQGQPADLVTFRSLFAPPPDDPGCFKLQARIAEELGNHDIADQNWRRYEAWLATKPAGWPEPLLQRVRAQIWHHLGCLAEESSLACFRRAVELAPDWLVASGDLYGALVDDDRIEEAEQFARATHARHPDALEPVTALADNLRRQGRFAESLQFYRRARDINPLDPSLSMQTAFAAVSAARALLFEGNPDAALACLSADNDVLEKHLPSHLNALTHVIALKRGDREAAARLLASLDDRHRLADRFRIAVDSLLAKLKPADRKAADAAFAEILAEPQRPIAVLSLLLAWSIYRDDGLTYRGQKTQEKKFLTLADGSFQSAAPELEFEKLGEYLAGTPNHKDAKKYLDRCISRFRKNPLFLVLRSELALDAEESGWSISSWVVLAKELAEKSKEPHHRALMPRINELLASVPNPFSFLDSFFDRKR